MNRIATLLIFLCLVSCNDVQKQTTEITDNQELTLIYQADQADRKVDKINWDVILERDQTRRKRVQELLDSNQVRTSEDYHHAAMIFQHGMDTVASSMAVKLMRKAIELDSTINKWLLAAAVDRHLMRKGEPQIYGTQFTRKNGEPWSLYKIDTTVISDKERLAFGVRTLTEQQEQVKRLNRKKLSELVQEGKSAEELLVFLKEESAKENRTENKVASQYDISEYAINMLGYQLMTLDSLQGALKIFKLNTELYPKGYNTFDSYGECLLKLGQKEEAIKAYKKSLELNPDNDNAKEVLAGLE